MVADCLAGLTIGVMLIPQSMAYALLANMPPIMGMYTAVIAPITYCFLGTSMHLQIGPTSLVRPPPPLSLLSSFYPTVTLVPSSAPFMLP